MVGFRLARTLLGEGPVNRALYPDDLALVRAALAVRRAAGDSRRWAAAAGAAR